MSSSGLETKIELKVWNHASLEAFGSTRQEGAIAGQDELDPAGVDGEAVLGAAFGFAIEVNVHRVWGFDPDPRHAPTNDNILNGSNPAGH